MSLLAMLPRPVCRAMLGRLAAALIALVPAAAASAAEPAETRVETHTESFELVVQASGPRLTLYLDRYADNAPVTDARIELDAGGTAVAVQPQPDGSYAAQLPAPARRATLPLTVVVTAGQTSDLLAVELPAEQAARASDAAPGGPAARAVTAPAVLRGLLIGGVLVGLLVGLTALARRALGRRRRARPTDRPHLPGKDVA